MATIYPHKKAGREVFQIRFILYLPDGRRRLKYRYRPTKDEATDVLRHAECIERGSRSCNLSPREIIQAQHDGLLSAKEVELFTGRPVYYGRRYRLSELIACFSELHQGQWRPRSKQKVEENFRKIFELLGDVFTDDIDQGLLLAFSQRLSRYPKWRNHAHLRHLSLEQCMVSGSYQSISPATFDGIWTSLGALLTFGVENGDYGVARNFCSDRVFSLHRKLLYKAGGGGSDRLPYDAGDIERLVIRLGLIDKRANPHKLWIPLIALFNGMRQGEICQLFCDDVIFEDGVYCFRIRDCAARKQSVKNEQSRRIIPIHPALVGLGFMEFRESRLRLGFERLWEGGQSHAINYYERQDSYSHYFEKWFNGTFRKYVVLDVDLRKRKPFHSLRHTFINWFFQNVRSHERDNAAVKGLVGHLESDEAKMIDALLKGTSWEVYSQQLTPMILLNTLKLLNFEVDLSPLGLPITW